MTPFGLVGMPLGRNSVRNPSPHRNFEGAPSNLQDAGATAQEMPSIIVGVEADKIAVQNAFEDFITNGENAEDLTAGEWRVQKETDFDLLAVSDLFSQHGWQKHEVVIMYPDEISFLGILRNVYGEKSVGFAVCLPHILFEVYFTRMIMEQRPQYRICSSQQLRNKECGVDK